VVDAPGSVIDPVLVHQEHRYQRRIRVWGGALRGKCVDLEEAQVEVSKVSRVVAADVILIITGLSILNRRLLQSQLHWTTMVSLLYQSEPLLVTSKISPTSLAEPLRH
jgi:hypothetical protein